MISEGSFIYDHNLSLDFGLFVTHSSRMTSEDMKNIKELV